MKQPSFIRTLGGAWQRVLATNFAYVVMSLDTEDVNAEIIHRYDNCLPLHSPLYAHIPASVYLSLIEHFGYEKTLKLMTFDYLPHIDWQRFSRNITSDNGCLFELCKIQKGDHATTITQKIA